MNTLGLLYPIEIEIPYDFASMLEAEQTIHTQVNQVGVLTIGEALT